MREILFRGKLTDDGKWIEGYYCPCIFGRFPSRPAIISKEDMDNGYWHPEKISPSTVGQYTGLTDKYGKKIFVGDIIIYGFKPCVVKWDEDNASFCLYAYGTTKIAGFNRDTMKLKEIIGNIYDSPELLEGVAQ